MLEKIATFKTIDAEALNKPSWADIVLPQIKLASIRKDNKGDLGGFDLQAALKEHPDHLFVKVFAIKKDEVNDNGDAFSEAELKKATHTFIGVPVFTNHQNDDVMKAKGKVVHAWYDEDKGGIYTINMVDKFAYAPLARGIEAGYINGTSMGAQVGYSCCNACHNKAHNAEEFCEHIKNQKNKKISAKIKCCFHDSKCKPTEEECPICGCKKGEEKYHNLKQAQVHEWNYNIKFIEDSFVVNPACHSCLVECVLNVPEIQKKVADFKSFLHTVSSGTKLELTASAINKEYDELLKVASVLETDHAHEAVRLSKLLFADVSKDIKTSGRLEVEKLNEAMGLMEIVARSMMDQKQQVSMEYVSDVVDVLSDLQKVTDELVEMGYNRLPSPPTMNNYVSALQSGQPVTGAVAGQPAVQGAVAPVQQPQQPAAPEMKPPDGGVSGNNGLVTITKPASSDIRNIKESSSDTSNISERISALRAKIVEALARRVTNTNEMASASSNTSTTQDLKKELQSIMADNQQEKLAAGKGQTEYTQQVTTEKQLDDIKDKGVLHPRTETHPDGITESDKQLGKGKAETDVTSDSPQVRLDNPSNVVSEKQLSDVKEGYVTRWNEYPEVITEKQWTDLSRIVGSVLSDSQDKHTTEAQLRDLLSSHTWTEPNPHVITEKQIAEGGFGDQGQAGSLDRLDKSASASYDAKKIVLAATNVLADMIANFGKTPEEVATAAAFLNSNPQNVIKGAYLTLINGTPTMIANRKAEVKRQAYFSKVADTRHFIQPVDALTACMGDHCTGIRAEDLAEAVGFVASEKALMSKVEAAAKTKIASHNEIKATPVVDKFAALRQAAAELDRPEDGLYQIRATINELGVSTTDKVAFAVAANKFASATLSRECPSVEAYGVDLKVNEDRGVFAVTMKEASLMSDGELKMAKTAAAGNIASKTTTSRSDARAKLIKEAQMGGGMPGDPSAMGGAAPGAAPMGAPGGAAGAAGAPGAGAETMLNDMGDDAAADTSDLEPMPPGSVCPVCTSEDVDIVEGKGKCKACTAEFTYKVQIDVTKWPNTLDKGEEKKGEEAGEGEGEGFALPDAGTPAAGAPGAAPMGAPGAAGGQAGIPMAAMTRITPNIVRKVSEIKDRVIKAAGNEEEMLKIAAPVAEGGLGIKLRNQEHIAQGNFSFGTISPLTGSTNTKKVAGNIHICLDTGTPYAVDTAVSKADVRNPYVQWRWLPKTASSICPSCRRIKKAFAKALDNFGIANAQFDSMDLEERGKVILAAKEAGHFGMVKTASGQSTVLGEFKKAYAMPKDLFPSEQCRERIARRFGKDAIAMSGPCEGQNLPDCVCNSLKRADVYAESLAIKVAGTWSLKDASEWCVTDFIRAGLDVKQAATCCTLMKHKYAQSHEFFLEKLAGSPQTTGSNVGLGYYINGLSGAMIAGGFGSHDSKKLEQWWTKAAQIGGMGTPTGGMGGMGGMAPAPTGGMGMGGMGEPEGADLEGSIGGAPVDGTDGLDAPDAGMEGGPGSGDEFGGAPEINVTEELRSAKDALDALREQKSGQIDPEVEDAINRFNEAFEAAQNSGAIESDGNEIGGDVDPFSDTGGDMGGDVGGEMGGDVPPTDGSPNGMPGSPETEVEVDVDGNNPTDPKGGPGGGAPLPEVGDGESDVTPPMGDNPIDAPNSDFPSDKAPESTRPEITSPEGVSEPVGEEVKVDDSVGDIGEPHSEPDGDEDAFGEEPEGEHSETDEKPEEKEKEKAMDLFANSMKRGVIGKTGRISMDLSKVRAVLDKTKVAGAVKTELSQDAVPFKYEGGKPMGQEQAFKAETPEVKSDEAKSKMGNEEPPKAKSPVIDTGDQRMGHEGAHLKPELTDRITGGIGGAGGDLHVSTASMSTKQMQLRLAERLIAASEKKLETSSPTPTSQTEGIGKVRDGKVHPNADAEVPFSAEEPKNLKGKEGDSVRGHEEESINADGKGYGISEKTAPEIPTEGKADKVTELRGIAASSGSEKSQQYSEAMKLAVKMAKHNLISENEVEGTINDLSQYKLAQIKAYENKLFSVKTTVAKPAKKGLAAVQDGHEGQAVISYDANVKTPSLADRISKCFSLTKQNDSMTEDMSSADLRKTFNR